MTVLGTKVRDKATGFVGTATARIEYLGGSPDVRIEGVDANGKPTYLWVDEDRVEAQ